MTSILDRPLKSRTFTSVSLRRRAADGTATVLVTLSMLVALIPLIWVLYSVVAKGFRAVTSSEWWTHSQADMTAFLTGGGAYHAIQHSDLIQPIQSPPQLDHRYLHEDVGWGLVPWMHLAAAAGSPAPTISALTHLAGVINGIDYPREGLTLERMGLARKTPSEIRAHVGASTAELAGVPAPESCRSV